MLVSDVCFILEASDGDDLAELIDRSRADVLRLSRYTLEPSSVVSIQSNPSQRAFPDENNRATESSWLPAADPAWVPPFRKSDGVDGNLTITLRVERAKECVSVVPKELPSTSEMVSIAQEPHVNISSYNSRSPEPQTSPMQMQRQLLYEEPTRRRDEYCESAAGFSDHFHNQPQVRMLGKQPQLFHPGELVRYMETRNPDFTTDTLYESEFFERVRQQEQQQQMSPLAREFEFQPNQSQQRQPMSLSQLLVQSREESHHETSSPLPATDYSQESQSRQELRIQQLQAELEEKNAQVCCSWP